MMMNRGNQILAAILVVQLALVAVFFWPRSATVAGGVPLLPGLEADQVARLTIADEAGAQVQLAKRTGRWVLPEAGDYPCKEDAVPDLVAKLVALQTDRLVTQTRASHKRLKVADQDYAHRVDVERADGGSDTLYLGTSPSYSTIHVRLDGQDEVYLASGLSGADVGAGAATWVDTLYYSAAPDQVVSLTLQNGNGQFVFQKDDAGTWTMDDLPEGETLSQNNVTSLVNRVASVRLTRPLGSETQADYGLDTPRAVIVIQIREGEGTTVSQTLHVGAASAEDNTYVLKSSESPYYVRVAQYTVEDWIEKTLDDFLEQPVPTPAPAP
jgi:hypothetical protein